MSVGWDDARTVALYEAFNEGHDRYRQANKILVAHARISPNQHVLDIGAGIGGTAQCVLARLGPNGRIVCVEPALAMRKRGAERIDDPRVEWRADVPTQLFDRIVSGAAIWQITGFERQLASFAERLTMDGALVFNIPAAYLGEPDEPGGGKDPWLTVLPEILAANRKLDPVPCTHHPDSNGLESYLRSAGLSPERFEFRQRLTQVAYRDWLKIPPVSDRLLAGVEPTQRTALIDAAFAKVDAGSWRWERWLGFRAWKLGSNH